MNLGQLFDLTLQTRANDQALEFYDRDGSLSALTFAEVGRRAQCMAAVLQNRGLARGDRLCVYLANCVEMIDLYLACVRLGVIFVPINILYRERELHHILRDAEPKAVVSDADVESMVPVWRPAELRGSGRAAGCAGLIDGDTPAALIYTSGTTGAAKGAILSHDNFAANAVNLLACWQITEADRFLLPLPLFHVHALGNGLHCWLLT